MPLIATPRSLALALLWLLAFGCSSDDTGDSGAGAGSGGMPPPVAGAAASDSSGISGAGAGGGGASGSGGTGGTLAHTGSAGTGGAAGALGGAGGAAGSSSDGGTSGSAGAGDGGTGGEAGSTASMATPSAGCTTPTARPADGLVTVSGNYYLLFPESYDGTQPYPVLIGFHGCGGVNRGTTVDDTEWVRLTNGTAFETDYVRAVPISADDGGCWNYDTDIARVKAMYDALAADHCVDTSRVFGTGHSSGAQFLVQILLSTHTADAQHLGFAGVAPVAASDYGPMTGPIPVMYIQGMMDMERGNGDGHETVQRFRDANGCESSSMQYTEVAGCQSGATNVEPGCIRYDGCDAETIWCSHDDPAYSGTMHGVPCFGLDAMHAFFESLM